mmetsp:Transcript_31626/g.77540  ORF Transcript_31626/g.77540 Transcript_31626/m.77540 type:complete len:551 (+) Transcript_31626:388-2040(+)
MEGYFDMNKDQQEVRKQLSEEGKEDKHEYLGKATYRNGVWPQYIEDLDEQFFRDEGDQFWAETKRIMDGEDPVPGQALREYTSAGAEVKRHICKTEAAFKVDDHKRILSDTYREEDDVWPAPQGHKRTRASSSGGIGRHSLDSDLPYCNRRQQLSSLLGKEFQTSVPYPLKVPPAREDPLPGQGVVLSPPPSLPHGGCLYGVIERVQQTEQGNQYDVCLLLPANSLINIMQEKKDCSPSEKDHLIKAIGEFMPLETDSIITSVTVKVSKEWMKEERIFVVCAQTYNSRIPIGAEALNMTVLRPVAVCCNHHHEGSYTAESLLKKGALADCIDVSTIRPLQNRPLRDLFAEFDSAMRRSFQSAVGTVTTYPTLQASVDVLLQNLGGHVPKGSSSLTLAGFSFDVLLLLLGNEACAAADDPDDTTITYSFNPERCVHRIESSTGRLRSFFDGRDFGEAGFDSLGEDDSTSEECTGARLTNRLLKVLPCVGDEHNRAVVTVKLDALRSPDKICISFPRIVVYTGTIYDGKRIIERDHGRSQGAVKVAKRASAK